MTKHSKTILFLSPVAFVQRPDEPGFQVQTQNFRSTFEFVLPKLREKNMEVVLVSLNHSQTQLRNGQEYMVESGLDKVCRPFFLRRKMGRGRLGPQFIQFFINLYHLVGVLRQTKPAVMYGYNDVGTLYGGLLKLFFRYRLVYDMRGDRVDEMAVQGAPAWRVHFYWWIRNFCLRTSSLVFTVSRSSDGFSVGKKHVAKYNFYDGRHFFYDADVASEMRQQLGLENRFVFVYSGTDKYYQMVPEMVRFFTGFLKICPDAWLMINTPVRSEKFLEELSRHGVPESAYGMFHLNQHTLNRYQMVADMAFLIREDFLLNHRAFPTKFSEYLASGVPVLVTPHVHTLVEMVRDNGLGEVWEPHESESEVQQRILKYRSDIDIKKRCAAFAREQLSWQNKASWLAEKLHSLTQ